MTAIKNYVEYIISMLVNLGVKVDCTQSWKSSYVEDRFNDETTAVHGKVVAEAKIGDIALSDKITKSVFNIADTSSAYYFVTSMHENGGAEYYYEGELPDILRENEPDEDGFGFVLKNVMIFGKARLHYQIGSYYYDDECGYYTDAWRKCRNVILLEFIEEKVNGRFGKKSDLEVMAENKPDDLLQAAVYATGIAAFIGKRTIEEISQDLLYWFYNFKSFGNVCCAWKDQTIGPVGFYVSGEVNLASNKDLWSWRTDDGVRHFNPRDERAEEGIICRKEELDFTLHSHCEFFVRPQRIRGIWITANFASRNPDFVKWAKDIAQLNGVKLFIIKNRYCK